MKKVKDFSYYPFLFLVMLSAGYITKISHFSPAYIGFGLAIVFIPLLFIYKFRFFYKNEFNLFVYLIFYFIYLVVASLLTHNSNILARYISGFLFNQFIFLLTIFFMKYSSKNDIMKALKAYLFFTALIIVCDTLYRFTHASNFYTGRQWFYNFKNNAIMFDDSNWTGFISMLNFSMLVYLRDRKISFNKLFLPLYFILTCLTFSRAAVVCQIVVLLYSWNIRKNKINKRFVIICFVPMILLFVMYIVKNLNDDSFGTKLALMKGLIYYLQHNANALLLGNGIEAASNGEALLGRVGYAGHLYLIVKIIDIGLIGFLFEIIFFIKCIKYSKGSYYYLFIPFALCGLSMCPSNLSFFYMLTALMVGVENEYYSKSIS